jgi:protein arginine N-methyltransferase 1
MSQQWKTSSSQAHRWVAKTPKNGKRLKEAEPAEAHRWTPKNGKKAKDSENVSATETFVEESLEEFSKSWSSAVTDMDGPSSKDYYFDSYAHFGIHEDMLKDQVRTGAYMKAILNNPKLFEGKTVLDVGSGTGILCLFAAKAGAKQCLGIECSEIAGFATSIAQQNGYGDIITYIHGKVEEVELPVDKVDIIISEWMGYFLIYESMLDSVLYARDRWLVDGGLIFPDHAKLYAAGIEDADYKEEKIGFWSQQWGFDFSPMQDCVIQEPVSDVVMKQAIATTSSCILELDLYKCSRQDLDFVVPYSLQSTRKDFVHALVFWFEVTFDVCSPSVMLSTAPGKPNTHWKQSVLYFKDVLVAHKGDTLSGMLAVRKTEANPRDLDVKLSFELDGKYGHACTVQYYKLR